MSKGKDRGFSNNPFREALSNEAIPLTETVTKESNKYRVITREEYNRMLAKEEEVTFLGWVQQERTDPGKPAVRTFQDIKLSRGILKIADSEGVAVQTFGERNRSDSGKGEPVDDIIRRFEISILIPHSILEEKGLVAALDTGHGRTVLLTKESVQELGRHFDEQYSEQTDEDTVSLSLSLSQIKQKQIEAGFGRSKAHFIHNKVVEFIKNGGKLQELEQRVAKLEKTVGPLKEHEFNQMKDSFLL